MDIEPGRSVLVNRVENIPAPPAFVFRAFDSSSPLPAARCESIDDVPASRRIQRSGKVDCAPCVVVNAVPQLAPVVPRPLRLAPKVVAAAAPKVVRRERSRRVLRSRTLLSKPAQVGGDLVNVLCELEAAFGEVDNSTLSVLLQSRVG